MGVWVGTARYGAEPWMEAPVRTRLPQSGIRLRRWVSFHGFSINVEPDLSHFEGIVPCGVPDRGVTSLADLGLPVTMADLDVALKQTFEGVFGASGASAPDITQIG